MSEQRTGSARESGRVSKTAVGLVLVVALLALWVATPFINDRSGAWGLIYWLCIVIVPTVGVILAFRWKNVLLGIVSAATFLAWPILLGIALVLGGI